MWNNEEKKRRRGRETEIGKHQGKGGKGKKKGGRGKAEREGGKEGEFL